MTHDDGRSVELADDTVVVVDDLGYPEVLDGGGIAPQRVDVAFHAGPAPGDHSVTSLAVAVRPVLPTACGHPKTVDENDRVDGSRFCVVSHIPHDPAVQARNASVGRLQSHPPCDGMTDERGSDDLGAVVG